MTTPHKITKTVADRLFKAAIASPKNPPLSYTGYGGRLFLTIAGKTWEVDKEGSWP